MTLPPMKSIARIRSDFPTKFGIPRQSGLVQALRSTVVFEPEFRNPDALRGLEGFDYIWLIWQFSASVREDWSPTVRPPRLGGLHGDILYLAHPDSGGADGLQQQCQPLPAQLMGAIQQPLVLLPSELLPVVPEQLPLDF